MTQAARRTTTVLTLSVLGGLALAMDLHRHILAALWPLYTSFLDTYITF
jgi:hypothetical protein